MAMCIFRFVFITIFLLNYAQFGAALKCFDCKSNFHESCDHMNPDIAANQDCSHSVLVKAFPQLGKKYMCVVHKMEQKDRPEYNVVRGCVPEFYCDNYKDSLHCTVCETDLCNSSSAILPSIGLFISFILLKYYI